MEYTIRFAAEQWARLKSALWEREDVESAAILLATVSSNGAAGTVAVQDVLPVPDHAYRVRKSDFIEIDPVWMNAQCREARRDRRAVLTIHTHLTDGAAWFSWADDSGDSRLMPALTAQIPDTPHGSLNLTRAGAVARVLQGGELHPARIAISGERLEVLTPSRSPSDAAAPAHARQELALGRGGQARLRRVRVGVVGLGGTGSVMAALLARLGVDSITLVDDDTLEDSNLSRVLGSGIRDVAEGTSKVEIAEREARRVSSTTVIATHPQALASEADLGCVVGCDLIFSCVDRLAPRALLNRHAYGARVPVIDMGSAFRVDEAGVLVSQGGKVVIIGPGRPCLWCWGDLDAERIRIETLSREQRDAEEAAGYIQGANAPQPSVVTFNASLASAAASMFVQLVTSYAGASTPDRLNFNFATGAVTRATARRRDGCRFCALGPSGRG